MGGARGREGVCREVGWGGGGEYFFWGSKIPTSLRRGIGVGVKGVAGRDAIVAQ